MRAQHRIVSTASAAVASFLLLSACGTDAREDQGHEGHDAPASASSEATGHEGHEASSEASRAESSAASSHGGGHDHGAAAGGHDHAPDGGAPPEGIQEAADPTYPVGTSVVLTADHMSGMEGSEATISGAFDTTTYAVTYTPTDGGEPVEDHRWVVHEELQDPGEAPLPEGAEVVLHADHMAGMEGAEATIDSSTRETVYMVDMTMDGMEMTNHKWVVESEIQPEQ